MRTILLTVFISFLYLGCNDNKEKEIKAGLDEDAALHETEEVAVKVIPVSHASMVLQMGDTVIYVDPVGGAGAFEGQPEPDLILVTDIHGDHLNEETLQAVKVADTKIIAPQAVADKLPESLTAQVVIMNNAELRKISGLSITSIPMYNLREEALKFHEKGRGNGYVLEKNGTRIYISGDTEDIPEMRALKDIDIAFVCMNLPYTMTVESAADAVLEFKPSMVYPYHYRGTNGLSDVSKFKSLVNAKNDTIEVVQLDWYPSNE